MTVKDNRESIKAIDCYICEKYFRDDKVRDHCHLIGKYRGAAHNECNIHYRIPQFYPVYFHDLSKYDAHLFVKSLGRDITCIPCTKEKYISYSRTLVMDTYKEKIVDDNW